MGYGKEVYAAAQETLRDRRRRAEEETHLHRSAFYACYPRAQQIEWELSHTAVQAARAVLNGQEVKRQLTRLKEHNLSLQRELKALLQAAELPMDYLVPHYNCSECEDTGYRNGRMCGCFRELLRETAYQRLNSLTPLSLSTFESFSLRYYSEESENGAPSPRRQMENNLRYCMDYAAQFSRKSSNLILTGPTGLGKTHLSLAIANQVLQKGFGVVYGSVNNLMEQLEREHFGREESDGTSSSLTACDLLILDDLGTEFRTAFSVATVYDLINTRLLRSLPTIISTNLKPSELLERYSERFTSRIIGSYRRIPFLGRDVRQQKRMEQR